MSKKPFEILLTKIIKETLLLEEVNEEKISYHVGLMTSAVQSPEGGALIQSALKRVVIGVLKQIAIVGSPSEASLANLIDTSMLNSSETASNFVTLAEIDQSADPDLYDILVTAMAHFINEVLDSIVEEIPHWLLYGDRDKDFEDQMYFIDENGNEVLPQSEEVWSVTGIRFVYEPNEKIEFMKKFAQFLMELADARLRYCWGRIPDFELKDYDFDPGLFYFVPVNPFH